ncbi:hypothetical protein D7X74_01940 [Corallococcus sp. CA047B]|nr:hypothetical protein D7X74_01940 [Corallococcus sp. CA047B]
MTLEGTYREESGLEILMNAEATSGAGVRYAVLLEGRFAPTPTSVTAPAAFQGEYNLYRLGSDGASCTLARELTATRQ